MVRRRRPSERKTGRVRMDATDRIAGVIIHTSREDRGLEVIVTTLNEIMDQIFRLTHRFLDSL